MKKALQIAVIVFFLLLLARFLFGGSEDDWICVDNQWVKHGTPNAPKPTGGCGQ